jgi:hypothetical protein
VYFVFGFVGMEGRGGEVIVVGVCRYGGMG